LKTTKHPDETHADLECRKVMRKEKIPTRTQKPSKLKKSGNPARSMSMLGYGAAVYQNVGFLIINPDLERFSEIAAENIHSGKGKKSHYKKKMFAYRKIKPMKN